MITTLSRQAGRRYPQMRSIAIDATWLPEIAAPSATVSGAFYIPWALESTDVLPLALESSDVALLSPPEVSDILPLSTEIADYIPGATEQTDYIPGHNDEQMQ